MKEKPIIMSGDHPKLILDGTKTQTRRVIKLKEGYTLTPTGNENVWAVVKLGKDEKPIDRLDNIKCPYGQVGDRLGVKETHYKFGKWTPTVGKVGWTFKAMTTEVRYLDNPPDEVLSNKQRLTVGWFKRPSMFMFKRDIHIWLEITEVRVARVQEITEGDAKAEGCFAEELKTWWQGYTELPMKDLGVELLHQQSIGEKPPDWMIEPHRMLDRPDLLFTAKNGFRILWDFLNAKRGYGWETSPWCWCISFKVV